MSIDFAPFFKRYEALVALSEETFSRVRSAHDELVNCRIGCDDCCYAIFDLTLIESIYINHHFRLAFRGRDREERLEIANRVDRNLHKIKRRASREFDGGKRDGLILAEMAGIRVRCPLLNDRRECDLYAYRPVTCRLYGVPTAIGGEGYTCGRSGFAEGEPYPTVNLDPVQSRLFEISAELLQALRSKHVRMADMVVPLSMALLTDYDDSYLGVDGGPEG